jgi:hypothetical protein
MNNQLVMKILRKALGQIGFLGNEIAKEQFNPCYFCGKSDWQTFPTVVPRADLNDTIEWTCRRHLWDGYMIIDAFTGMPITMLGNAEPELWPYDCEFPAKEEKQ